MTPEDLRRRAAELDDHGKALLKEGRPTDAAKAFIEAEVYDAAADEMERLGLERVGKGKGLPQAIVDRSIRSMSIDTRDFSANVKRGVGRATRKHPAQLKLYQKGATITSVAKELRETRARVSSWMNPGKEARAIPRYHAEYLRERYGIPLSAWARISD